MHRRQFLSATGTSLLITPPTRLLPATSDLATGNPDADTIREITHAFRKLRNRYGGGHIQSTLTSFLSTTVEPKLRAPGNGKAKGQLFSAAAELYLLASWILGDDTGQTAAGRTHTAGISTQPRGGQ